ncbi:ABC transporter permease [Oceanobacillus kimchii]|uniref:ABC transporter permease n=1 Tax=Oceanobacillus kimchii TaxID=746691 RepID=UPI00034841D8|nr:FtsX-like permease family protein [Oceanobacillus kimchii]
MNIVNKVTIRHLKENKRRTLVTIIGVIISVAMITAVATLGLSFLDLNQRQTIENTGEWHYSYNDLNEEQYQAVKDHDKTESIALMNELGFAPLEGEGSKPYVYVHQLNKAGMDQFQVKLQDGRLPKKPNEVVLSEVLLQSGYDKEIGDTIHLEVGKRYSLSEEMAGEGPLNQNTSASVAEGELEEELRNTEEYTFTVVGTIEEPLWDYSWAPGYSMLSYIDEDILATEENVTVFVKSNDISTSLFDAIPVFAKNQNIDQNQIEFNYNLLEAYVVSPNEGAMTTVFGLIAIIIVIIMIGSVALIYNAFAISVSERSRYLGMLSSIGATKRQKRNSVFFEGIIISLISIPLGVGAGLLGIGITLYFVNRILSEAQFDVDLQLIASFGSIGIAVVISFITIMISAYIPAIRASKVTAIDAIRQSKDIKLTKKKVKANPLVRKIFGYEAEIALKNLKRNKKRYNVTVLSLIVSIVLFLSVGYFSNTMTKSFELQSNQLNYDIAASSSTGYGGVEELKQVMDNIQGLQEVNNTIMYQKMNMSGIVKEEMAGEPITSLENASDYISDQGVQYFMQFIALEDKALQDYAEENGISYSDIDEGEGILINHVSYPDDNQGKYVETEVLDAEVGDSVIAAQENYDEETGEVSFERVSQIDIAGLADHFPMGNFYPSPDTLFFVVSEKTLANIDEQTDYQPDGMTLYIQTEDPVSTQEYIEELEVASELNIANQYFYEQQDRQMTLILSIFVYGFITLITLISVANIFNTISTSVALRRREFATMKSIGMTPKAFRKMIQFESVFYGLKSLLYGLPISIGVMYLIYNQTQNTFSYSFSIPWINIAIAILAVFVIVSVAMLYSISKIKDDNIIETLRQENI